MVWVDGTLAVDHGAATRPSTTDITDIRQGASRAHEIVVRTRVRRSGTSSRSLAASRTGSSSPHSIWYPRTTGIWQTVWLERVPATRIGQLQWDPNIERWEIGLDAFVIAPTGEKLRLSVKLWVDDLDARARSVHGRGREVHRRIALSDPGIDDFRNELLWSPISPS